MHKGHYRHEHRRREDDSSEHLHYALPAHTLLPRSFSVLCQRVLQGSLEDLFVLFVVSVLDQLDNPILDQEEPWHVLDVVAGGEPAARVLEHGVGGISVSRSAVDVDYREGHSVIG